MKKILFLFVLSVLIFGAAWSQTPIHTNACASATAGWTFTNAGGIAIQQAGYWLVDAVGDYIISEPFNVTSYTELTLTFKVGTYGSGTNHSCLVEYSTDGGSSWNATTFTSATPTSSTMVTAGTWSLGTISSTQLKFRWSTPSGGAKGVRLDDILFQGTASTPTVNVTPSTLTGFTYVYGSGPSTPEKTFTVGGTNLTNGISVAAPTNYEISKTSGTGYTTPLTYTIAEVATAQTIYVRLKSGLAIGSYNSETITATSFGAPDKTVTCSGSVTTPPPPAIPVATAATLVDNDSFTANWGAVTGATGYELDVYTLTPGFTTLTEGFEGYSTATPPTGWTLSSTGSYIQNFVANAHGGINSAGINAVSGWVQSPLLTNPTTMTFWGRTTAATAVYVAKIQTSLNNIDWADQATYTAAAGDTGTITSTYAQYTISLNLTGNYYVRWFMFSRTTGSLYFDDVAIGYTGQAKNYILNAQSVITGNSYPVSGLSSETNYYYIVRSYNTYGSSVNSNQIAATTLPTSPVAASATAVSHEGFTASWSAVTGATGYAIDVFDGVTPVVEGMSVSGTIYRVSSLTASTAYTYVVRAVTASGTSANSNVISVSTTAVVSGTSANTAIGGVTTAVIVPPITGFTDNGLELDPNTTTNDDIAVSVSGTTSVVKFGFTCSNNAALNGVYLLNHTGMASAPANVTVNSGTVVSWTSDINQTLVEISGFGAKGTLEITLDVNAPLPVVLSSFSAVLNAQNNVNILWVTQTETSLTGFYVLRAGDGDFSNAVQVSSLINPTNTSSQQNYQFTDSSIEEAGIYYYWLQIAEMDGSSAYHGPIAINYTIGDNPGTPNIPLFTDIQSVYPNPFNPNATISYGLAKAADVNISIYNARGQVVRTFDEGTKAADTYKLIWNGKDNNGKDCSTGIYYIRMMAGKDSFIRKAVLMK